MEVAQKRIFGCLVCDRGRLDSHFEGLLKCPECGFITARIERGTEVREIYERDYFKGDEYLDYAADEVILKKNFRRRLDDILKRRQSGRLLEIGAAYGFFLDLAKARFQVRGFEVNPEAARYGRDKFGVDIRTNEFLDAQPVDLGGRFDVTVMWDVIEHLERPDLYLRHIAALSRPGALLYLTTGDIGSRLARWRGPNWRLIHPPSHLHYFDRQTIRQILARYGFEVREIKSVGFARSALQVLYSVLVLRLGWKRGYVFARRIIPPAWSFTINLGDIMQVVAEKVDPNEAEG